MTRRRNRLADAVAPAVLAAGTTWLATTAWHDFTAAPWRFAYPLLLVALVVAALGVALRRLRLPAALVVLTQLVVTAVLAGSLVAGEVVFTAEGWQRLGAALSAAVDSAQQYRAPVPVAAPAVDPLLVLGGAACLVLVDLCACTLRRVPLAGLPLLTIYSIPVSMVDTGVPWWSFALTALGFLLMLFWQQRDQTTRWGRGLDGEGHALDSPVVRAAAGSVGATALALAVVVPLFVPTLSLSVFGFGPGNGDGDSVTVENPMADLRRDLLRGDDVPLIRFTTDDPAPAYLRIAALTRFSDNEWSPGSRSLPTEQRATGAVPTDELDGVKRTKYRYDVEVLPEFHSRWLPTAFPVERISATGDWRYDTTTMDFLAFDDGLDTAGLDYEMTGVVPDYSAKALDRAPTSSGRVDDDYIDLPESFPDLARNLALEVTRDYPSRYAKAVALQRWFRKDGGFTYSLDRSTEGNGTDELAAFLTEGEGRVGYCEQFAAAMAAMARSLGIPARVAVGFLEPTRIGPGTYEYSAYDMHAWPELYFADAGWVRFEPTPADRASAVPAYTRFQLPQPDDEASSQLPNQSAGARPSLGPNPRLDPGNAPTDQTTGGGGRSWTPWLIGLAVLLVLVLLAWTPRLVRRARARRRLQGGAVEPAWAELRDTAVDLGVPWPEARSPRETRRALVPFLGAPVSHHTPERPPRGAAVAPDAVAALDRLVRDLEQSRYARPGPAGHGARPRAGHGDTDVVTDVRTVVSSLRGGATRRARRRATWRPASVLPWRRTPLVTQVPVLVRHGSVVDQVG